jgi:hypothetical protein
MQPSTPHHNFVIKSAEADTGVGPVTAGGKQGRDSSTLLETSFFA